MLPDLTPEPERWYALWTRSHSERMVHDQLSAKGFHPFLPTMDGWSKRGGRRHLISLPMFPGYLFLRHALDRRSHVEVRKARGLVAILGNGWDRPAIVSDTEIESIQSLLATRLSIVSHPFLHEGQRVRVVRGPLVDIEGLLVRTQPDKGLLVLSVNLLQRSVAVTVDCTDVEAV